MSDYWHGVTYLDECKKTQIMWKEFVNNLEKL